MFGIPVVRTCAVQFNVGFLSIVMPRRFKQFLDSTGDSSNSKGDSKQL